MIRAKLWLRCAAMHDPVTPVLLQSAIVGWEAKNRTVDLTIERAFTGDELLRRMKGWVTTDPGEVIDLVKKHGRLKVLDDKHLVVEFEGRDQFDALQASLAAAFGTEADLELMAQERG
jgi:hypothetical protein